MLRSYVIAGLAAALLFTGPALAAQTPKLQTREGDYAAVNFKFDSGETLARLRLHYTVLGAPHRDRRGRVDNAVLILHGTGGDGHQFLRPQFAGVLFSPGGLLDPAKYFIILPDGIGHGKSSKPSDGLRLKFPHYDYGDMIRAQHALVVNGLGVDHLRLVMGTSMGCMQSFMWGESWPEFVDALMPLACLPVEIAGRNRMWREMVIEAIRKDPAWMNGRYESEPEAAMRAAADLLVLIGTPPLPAQIQWPTREAADGHLDEAVGRYMAEMDANDFLYQIDASRDYDPSARLEKIKAPVMWVNSADDFINPPELGIAERTVKRIPRGRFVLIPLGEETHGHGTHTWAALWKDHLAELLKESQP